MRRFRRWLATGLGAMLGVSAHCAAAEPAWTYELAYTADVMGVIGGDAKHAGRYLDNLDLSVDGDLEKALGWSGATLHLGLLHNAGGRPNEFAQTLQGVDNIEVGRARGRIFELWIDQQLADGRASVRAGLYDLNSEFYSTEASQQLIAPPFGIGSEFSATGPNGPSIFPLTSLAVRLRIGEETGPYVQTAVLSAEAGSLTEPDNLQLGLDRGGIVIAEVGRQGPTRVAFGAWTYTEPQERLDGAGETSAFGGYLLAEKKLSTTALNPELAAFVRVGASDGETSPFVGGWQAGLRLNRVFASRPESALSFGLQQAYLSAGFRDVMRRQGQTPARAESGAELTYSDRIGPVTIQPDLQVFHHPGGDRDRDLIWIGGVRLSVAIG